MTILAGNLMPETGTTRDDLIANVEALMSLAHRLDGDADEARLRAVATARAIGMTWDQIGTRFGTSGHTARAAHERALARAARRSA